MKKYTPYLAWMLLLSTSACANDYDSRIDLVMSKMVEAFELEGGNRKVDEYTDLIKIEYHEYKNIVLLTHEVDIRGMLDKEYLDDSSALKIMNINKAMVCLSGFGVLLKNKLIKIEHVFLDKKSKHLVLKYIISSEDCGVRNEK